MTFENIIAAYQAFPEQFRTVILSTVDGDGAPHASYAPFVIDSDRQIYLYISGLAAHTAHLKHSQQASVLFIEDESKTEQSFARRRLTYQCKATVLDRESERWHDVAARFETQFGDIIATLKSLADFEIFQLSPYSGRFVLGFGAAYQVSSDSLAQLVPIKGR
ncbi:MAG: pyridoxamine 5'-phosphate oxidase family protein [Cyanobacteria bacterium P01_A01_bin.114]